MTKRIIGLILVVVMLTLSLVSCGYDFAKDDLSAYATLSDEQKAALLEKIKKITISDAEFTLDDATREKKVLDSVYAALASASTDKTNKTEGKPAAHDLVYYCYYVTADFDGTTVVLYAANMKQSSASSVQLGKSGLEGVAAKVAEFFADYEFKDATYTSKVSGKTAAGDIAYVSYTVSYTPAGESAPKSEKRINEKITIGAAVTEGEPTSFESYLCDKSIATAMKDSKTFGDRTYSDVTVNWVSTGLEFEKTYTEVTYTEDKNVTDTTNTTRNLKDKELTYHIFPVHYVSVPEFTAANIVSVILGKEITADAIYEMVLGEEWANLDEKEDAAKIEERAQKLANYKTAEEGLTIADVVDKILNTYTEEKELEDSLEEDLENLSDLEATVSDAENDIKETENPSEQMQKALEDAKAALETAKENIEKKRALIKEKSDAREKYTAAMIDINVDGVKLGDKLVAGYKITAYNFLQDAYNTEIKMNLAKEIYKFLEEEIKVVDVPKKALKVTYDRLVENYENEFYTGSNSTTKVTYYKENDGSFKKFLIKSVNSDYTKTVETYDEALAVLQEEAKKYVEPIVRIYVASKAFDVLATKEEYKEYVKDTDNNYSYNEYYYGENSVRYAYQFDKLMNHFLAYEEVKADADANGFVKVTFDYTIVEEIVFEEK